LNNIDEEILSIKKRLEAAQIAKVRGEATRDIEQENYDKAMAQIYAEFDVDNPDDIRARLAELQQELEDKIKEINSSLNNLNL
jgi:hypothetical protein